MDQRLSDLDEDTDDKMVDDGDVDYKPEKNLKSYQNNFDYPETVSSIRRSRVSYESGFRIMNR